MTAGSVSVPIIIPLKPPILGAPKLTIDTGTRVEIKTDTPGAKIYYTINGFKPEPFQAYGPEAKSTFLYSHPFLLPAGKRTVKAMAVSEHSKESYVVTKVFDVEQVFASSESGKVDNLEFVKHLPSNNGAKEKVKKFVSKLINNEAQEEIGNKLNHTDHDHGQIRFKNKFNNKDHATLLRNKLMDEYEPEIHNGVHPMHDANQFLRLQRETDFLRCPQCLAPRPSSDLFARYCNECGHPITPLVQNKLPPPQFNQIGRCFNCDSVVPLNTTYCLICECPLKPQNVNRPDVKLSAVSLCVICGTANQPDAKLCICCGSSLQDIRFKDKAYSGNTPRKSFNISYVKTCSKCGRANDSNARFCDWCKSKPFQCIKCCATNLPNALYCSNCGLMHENLQNNKASNPELNSVHFEAPVKKIEVGTQTVGLFYPSQSKFKHQELLESIVKSKLNEDDERSWTDRKPVLTSALSPGRGYWRKQIEHICAHLKAHSANDTNFRSLIAQPRMGKLLQATVHEDGYELNITLNFALRSSDGIVANNWKNKNLTNVLNSTDEIGEVSTRASKDRKITSSRQDEEFLDANKSLLKEVGKNGKGRPERIQALIDEGADPVLCISKDGKSLLHLAAVNKHFDAISVIVQGGLDVNVAEPTLHNTPLHEAVRNNSPGMVEVVEALLGCGANPLLKNKLGESSYDLAVKYGHVDLANKLSIFIGQANVSKLTKPRKTTSGY